jgi:hypothetical protein
MSCDLVQSAAMKNRLSPVHTSPAFWKGFNIQSDKLSRVLCLALELIFYVRMESLLLTEKRFSVNMYNLQINLPNDLNKAIQFLTITCRASLLPGITPQRIRLLVGNLITIPAELFWLLMHTRTILKKILRKEFIRLWNKFAELRTGFNGGPF